MGAPRDNMRGLIMNPAFNAASVGGFAGLFNGQAKLGRQYDSGLMVDSLGLSYAMDQNVAVHTNGAATATNINGAGQTGSSITVVAVAGGTSRPGRSSPCLACSRGQSSVSGQHRCSGAVRRHGGHGGTVHVDPDQSGNRRLAHTRTSRRRRRPDRRMSSSGCVDLLRLQRGFHEDAFTLAMVPMATPPDGTGTASSRFRTTATRSR